MPEIHSSWVFIILLNICKKNFKKSTTYRPVIHTFWKQVVQKYKKCELWPLILRHTWGNVGTCNTFWTSFVKSYHWCEFQLKRPIFRDFHFFTLFVKPIFGQNVSSLKFANFARKFCGFRLKLLKCAFQAFFNNFNHKSPSKENLASQN